MGLAEMKKYKCMLGDVAVPFHNTNLPTVSENDSNSNIEDFQTFPHKNLSFFACKHFM
mgnify:CR=1 FL=1